MKPEVFALVLLFSIAGSDAKIKAWSDSDPPPELIAMALGKVHELKGNTLTHSYEQHGFADVDYYYDHIIDLCLQRLKLNKKVYSIEANINKPEQHSSEKRVEGTIIFDGLHSLSRYKGDVEKYPDHTFSERLKNGDIQLNVTFKFENISGIGNFSGLNSKNDFFEFHPNRMLLDVSFIITKDPSRRNVSLKLRGKFIYHPSGKVDRQDINATLLLEQKALIAFERVFNDLSNIIHERLFSTARIASPHLDTVLDNVIRKLNQNASKPVYTWSNGTAYGPIESTNGPIRHVVIINRWNVSFSALPTLTKLSKVQVINEINGDIDLQTTIELGNISGNGFLLQRATDLERQFFQNFNFTSTPVVVEALFYLPRNESFAAKTINMLTKPIYTIHASKESFTSVFQQLLEKYGERIYSSTIYNFLNEIHDELFPTTNIPKRN